MDIINSNHNDQSIVGGVATQEVAAFEGETGDAGRIHSPMIPGRSVVPDLQDLKSYAARPWVLRQAAVSELDTVNFLPINSSYVRKSLGDRVFGAVGIRFTIKLRIQFMCTPFSQGLYRLTVVPFHALGKITGMTTNGFDIDNVYYNNPVESSQLPGVDINIQDSTSGEIEFPYTLPVDYLPVSIAADPTPWLMTYYGTTTNKDMCYCRVNVTKMLPFNAGPGATGTPYYIMQ